MGCKYCGLDLNGQALIDHIHAEHEARYQSDIRGHAPAPKSDLMSEAVKGLWDLAEEMRGKKVTIGDTELDGGLLIPKMQQKGAVDEFNRKIECGDKVDFEAAALNIFSHGLVVLASELQMINRDYSCFVGIQRTLLSWFNKTLQPIARNMNNRRASQEVLLEQDVLLSIESESRSSVRDAMDPLIDFINSNIKKTSGIGIGMGDSLMESLVKMGTKCRKCGSDIIFKDGVACAQEHGIRDNVVMCKKCKSVYEVDLTPSGMTLTTEVSNKYRIISDGQPRLNKMGDPRAGEAIASPRGAVETLIATLRGGGAFAQGSAAQKLGKMGKPAVEPLIEALRDGNLNARSLAAQALGKIGDPGAIEPLIKAMEDENKRVRKEAEKALNKIQN